jgi:hypothetical protein
MTFLTEGPLSPFPKPSIFGETDRAWFYWLTFGLMVLSLVVVDRILKSPAALRHCAAVQASGLHGRVGVRYKVYAFVIKLDLPAWPAACMHIQSSTFRPPATELTSVPGGHHGRAQTCSGAFAFRRGGHHRDSAQAA